MAGKAATQQWVALVGLNWIDVDTGKETRVEVGGDYAGPNAERLAAEGVVMAREDYLALRAAGAAAAQKEIVAPAPAGSGQPGNERSEAE